MEQQSPNVNGIAFDAYMGAADDSGREKEMTKMDSNTDDRRVEAVKKIRDARISKGMTQKELSSRIGYVSNIVAAWESHVSLPTVAAALKAAAILGIQDQPPFSLLTPTETAVASKRVLSSYGNTGMTDDTKQVLDLVRKVADLSPARQRLLAELIEELLK